MKRIPTVMLEATKNYILWLERMKDEAENAMKWAMETKAGATENSTVLTSRKGRPKGPNYKRTYALRRCTKCNKKFRGGTGLAAHERHRHPNPPG